MTEAVRRTVAERAQHRCEYCLSPDAFSTSPYDVEHIEPSARGGTDALANLAWACSGCNGSKGIAVEAIDPITGEHVPLFHPRRHQWGEHFAWSIDRVNIIGITPTGRATVERLTLNRGPVVNLRVALIVLGFHPVQETTDTESV
jgi:hypothetical protein